MSNLSPFLSSPSGPVLAFPDRPFIQRKQRWQGKVDRPTYDLFGGIYELRIAIV
jgi:hypothetical protein